MKQPPATWYFCACIEADKPGAMEIIDGKPYLSNPVCDECSARRKKEWESMSEKERREYPEKMKKIFKSIDNMLA